MNKSPFLFMFWALLLVKAGICAGTPQGPSKGKTIMTNTDKVAYSVRYANAQRNSYANASLMAIGKIAWKKVYTNDFNEMMAPPVAVLSNGNIIGVQVNPYFLVYRNGTFIKWHNSYESSEDVGLFLNSCYTVFLYHGSIDALYNYDGAALNKEIASAGVGEYWYSLLLFPYKKGFLIAKQYTGGPSRRTKEYTISYRVPGENLGVWYYGDDGQISDVLLTSVTNRILFTFQKKIFQLDPSTGKNIKEFDPGLPSIFNASLDLADNLIVYALNKSQQEVIAAFDLNGTKLWEHDVEGSIQNNQPPVCGENGTVFYIADSSLVCTREGKKIWKSDVFPCSDPLMTNSKGNKIIVQSGSHIMAFDGDGKQIFRTSMTGNVNEEFTAPPVIGGDGRVYAASGTALYCFK